MLRTFAFAGCALLVVSSVACSERPIVASDGALDGVDGSTADATPMDVTLRTDRAIGMRARAPGSCDATMTLRCMLPWPSDRHVVADSTRATGIHLHIVDPLPGRGDSAAALERDDGFSRLTPVIAGFAVALDDTHPPPRGTDGPMVLIAVDGPTAGQRIALRYDVVDNHQLNSRQSELIGHTAYPLAPSTEYLAIVTDELHALDGSPIAPTRDALVATGLAAPSTQDEADALAYYAPERATLANAHIDPAHVIRLWSFTTRSADDPLASLRETRVGAIAAVDRGDVSVMIDVVQLAPRPGAAMIVEGRLAGLPSYLGDDGQLRRDSNGMPMSQGTHDAPFRILVPDVTTATYPLAMWGHGLGGNFHDTAFDEEFAANSVAKIGLQFEPFTDTGIIATFGTLSHAIVGTGAASARVVQSMADGMAIQRALGSVLGDALASATIGGMPNPAAGHRPDIVRPMWTGGSLGGTLGLVYTSAEPSIVASVLNVPGAAWTHFVPASVLFGSVRAIVRASYASDIDLRLAIAMTQNEWDQVDGGAWGEALGARAPLMLLQESIGDPVLPNIGTEFMAAATNAVQLGAVIAPVERVVPGTAPSTRTTLTQFRVPANVTDNYSIHGFAAGDSIAGRAAREQFSAFLLSVRDGHGTITIPPLCANNVPAGSCDFSASH